MPRGVLFSLSTGLLFDILIIGSFGFSDTFHKISLQVHVRLSAEQQFQILDEN